jgi:hypothetical protein
VTWLAAANGVKGLESMVTTDSRRARPVAVLGGWAALSCAALLVTACSSPASSAASSGSGAARTAATSATATPAAPAIPAGTSAAPASAPGPSPSTASASPTAADTFIAEGQDINGTALYQPACANSGCALSGDSTTFLYQMTWTTWTTSEAVGAGTYKVDACDPDCAAGPVYPVPVVITLSQPVKVCSPSGARWYWSRASFRFPGGLPRALRGQDAPQNPWTFTSLVAAARQSCA